MNSLYLINHEIRRAKSDLIAFSVLLIWLVATSIVFPVNLDWLLLYWLSTAVNGFMLGFSWSRFSHYRNLRKIAIEEQAEDSRKDLS